MKVDRNLMKLVRHLEARYPGLLPCIARAGKTIGARLRMLGVSPDRIHLMQPEGVDLAPAEEMFAQEWFDAFSRKGAAYAERMARAPSDVTLH